MTPESFTAIFETLSNLFDEYHQAERWATNGAKSQQEDLRGVADEAKDRCMAYVAELLPAQEKASWIWHEHGSEVAVEGTHKPCLDPACDGGCGDLRPCRVCGCHPAEGCGYACEQIETEASAS